MTATAAYQQSHATFYTRRDADTRAAAEAVVPLVLDLWNATSVVDFGCGVGTWLSKFREHGATDVVGVEGEQVQPELLQIPPEVFHCRDLTQPLDLGRFDLAVALEVAEHLPPEAADTFVASLVQHAPVVMFSAAVPGQGGIHHVNEQWQSYWIGRFKQHGYACADSIRWQVWEDARIQPWYRQNLLLFVSAEARSASPALEYACAHSEAEPIDVVHPALFEMKRNEHAHQIRKLRHPRLSRLLRMLPGLMCRSIMARLGYRENATK